MARTSLDVKARRVDDELQRLGCGAMRWVAEWPAERQTLPRRTGQHAAARSVARPERFIMIKVCNGGFCKNSGYRSTPWQEEEEM